MVATVTESIIVGTDTEDDMTDGMQVCHVSLPSNYIMHRVSLRRLHWISSQCKHENDFCWSLMWLAMHPQEPVLWTSTPEGGSSVDHADSPEDEAHQTARLDFCPSVGSRSVHVNLVCLVRKCERGTSSRIDTDPSSKHDCRVYVLLHLRLRASS